MVILFRKKYGKNDRDKILKFIDTGEGSYIVSIEGDENGKLQ